MAEADARKLGPESIPVPPRPEPPRPNYSRRILWLALIVALAIAGYTGAWYWAAHKLETMAEGAIARIDRDPIRAECANLHAEGYPFRIGLFCNRVAVRDESRGAGVEAGAFRSAAQVYNPFLVVGEINGPAKVQAPGMPPLQLDWDVLKASVRLDQPLPDRVSVEGRAVEASGPDGVVFTADDMQGHVHPAGADLDLAARFDKLALAPALVGGRTIPPVAGSLDATLANGVAWVLARSKSLRGRAGVLRELRLIVSPDASLALAGPFSVSGDGLLDADFTLSLTGPKAMAAFLAEILPERADTIRAAFSGLAMLGDKPSLPLKITKGKVTLTFVQIGEVPPLQ